MLNSSSYISHQSDHFNHQCFLPWSDIFLNTSLIIVSLNMSVNINILVYSYLQIWAGQNIMLTLLKKTFKLSFILLSLFWNRIVRDIKMVDIQEVNVDCVSKRCWRADEQVIIIMNNPAFISITLRQKIFNTGFLRHPIFAIHVMVKENKTLKRAFPSDKALTMKPA